VNPARELLGELAVIGATIKPAGDQLILRAGPSTIPADLIIRIRQPKTELLDALSAAPASHGGTTEDWQAFYIRTRRHLGV
jgi:hypothetical protein